MIVYRDDDGEEVADPTAWLAAAAASARALAGAGRPRHDAVRDLLIELGRFEAAVADAIFARADGRSAAACAVRRASLAAGRLMLLSWREAPASELRAAALALAEATSRASAGHVPGPVRMGTPEGYAWYGLYPECHLEAADRFARECRPAEAVCLGLRGIGTSLSAVVAAAIEAAGCRTASWTLRPRGHPFDRRPVLTPELAGELSRATGGGAWFLVVDEGPGLSGSSLCGAAELVSGLGAPDSRIVLFPSHSPDPGSLNNGAARERWRRHAKAWASFEDVLLPRAPFPPGSRELSGGAWRGLLLPRGERWPAVEPRHERRKYLEERGPDAPAVLHKFVGLGGHGSRAAARAEALAEAGFGPPALGHEAGFLAQAFVPGRPLATRRADPELRETTARYVRHVASAFRLDAPARPDRLLPMIRANVAEGLGEDWLAGLGGGLEGHATAFGEVPAVALDGRMLPHEWVRTERGWLKADATDHHADHFFPGNADIAWDVAAFGEELGLDDAGLAGIAPLADDPHVARRLPFYRLAYLAFRLGYATSAAGALAGSEDGRRFERAAERYLRRLAAAVRRLEAVLPSPRAAQIVDHAPGMGQGLAG